MKKQSIWNKYLEKGQKSLTEDINTDILIIGAGITGLTTAYFLKDKDVTVIDKSSVGSGCTSKTTGKITYLQEQSLLNIIKTYDEATAYLYYLSQKEAIKILTNIIKENNIKCDLKESEGIIFTNNDKEINNIKKIEKFFDKYNIEYGLLTKLPINFPCKYGIKINDSYTFNPIKYLNQLMHILNINIYENTKANKIIKKDNYYLVETNKFKIKAKKVVVATHYPFFIKPFYAPFKTSVVKSYVISAVTDKNNFFNAITYNPTHSFRYYEDEKINFIYSSLNHPISKNLNIEKNYKTLIQQFKEHFNYEINYIWNNHDIMTNDYLPFIGKVNDNLYLATGYNKWGMTNGTIAGKIISDLINNKFNKFQNLFKLKRKLTFQKCNKNLYNNYLNSEALIKNKLNKNKKFYNKNPYITTINGEKVGIYIDDKKHVVSNVCPHMKCNLIFDNFNKTWVCPCHGSEYTLDGEIINGPSCNDIRKD